MLGAALRLSLPGTGYRGTWSKVESVRGMRGQAEARQCRLPMELSEKPILS